MKKYYKEICGHLLIMIVGTALLIEVDAFEKFYYFSRTHEHWELDEIILLIPIALICLTLFSATRFYELRHKTKDLKRSQAELAQANDRMRELARSKEDFMSIACHELKGPISGIVHSLYLLDLSRNDEDRKEAVEFVTSAAGGLQLLVDDVLAFSKITHEQPGDLSAFSIVNLLKSVQDLARPQAKAKKLALQVTADAAVPEKLLGNEGALRLATLNLVSNAIKYTDSGRITVQCDYRHDSGELIFSVTDTGVGIPETEQETIFEPYCKASSASQSMRDGLGLGLSIVKKLIEQQGGTISVSSTVGEGTEFVISLPATIPAHKQ